MDRATAVGAETTDYSYSADGNITYKSDYSPDSYLYGGSGCPGRPHFVTNVSTVGGSMGSHGVFTCDANGNVASRAITTPNSGKSSGIVVGKAIGPPSFTKTMNLAYDFQNLTLNINQDNSKISDFRYGADGNRYLEQSLDSGVTTTTHFGARGYEKSVSSGSITFRHELGPITIRKTDSGSFVPVSQMRDRLGSPLGQGSASGSITNKRAFDSFGDVKNGDFSDRGSYGLGLAPTTLRGFTGHEHLDNLGLIHMNGRIYDPTLGRFFSVDPVIQFPSNSQSLNPYSYILNNPLAGKDPSGYCSTGSHIDQGDSVESCQGMGVTVIGEQPTTRAQQTNAMVTKSINAFAAKWNSSVSRGNGANINQSPTGFGGSKDRQANTSDKGNISSGESGIVITGSGNAVGPVNLKLLLGLPRLKLGDYVAKLGESEEDLFKKIGPDARAYSDSTGYEACAVLCNGVDANSNQRYSATLYTFKSHVSCPILGSMCTSGSAVIRQDANQKPYAVGMHTHGQSGNARANNADEVLSGMRNMLNSRIPNQRLDSFSTKDYGRPGYLYSQRHGLLYQAGSADSMVIYGK